MSLATSDGPGWATHLNGVQQAIVAAHPTRARMGQDGPGWARAAGREGRGGVRVAPYPRGHGAPPPGASNSRPVSRSRRGG
jgi:hypothetical protein